MGQCLSRTSRRKADEVYEFHKRRSERYPPLRKLPLHTHSILKDYELTNVIIGTGASGPIRLVQRRCSGEKFALKILLDSATARREIELQFLACQHPNIVSIVDVYENLFRDCRCLFVVMEFMSGGHLLERIKMGHTHLTEREIMRIVRDLGSAIAYIHSLSIIHRDIKLENIFYSKNGVLKLTDFGFAMIEKEPHKATSYTLLCFAPSEIVDRIRCDKSRDMWSLGIVMYFLLCGYPPFCYVHETDFSEAMKQKIATGEYFFPAEQWDNVSFQAKSIVRKLLAADPEERMTADELMSDAWIVQCSRALDTPLCTTDIVKDEKFLDYQNIMHEQMTGIRAINKQIEIKPLCDAINPLLMRRRKIKKADTGSTLDTPISAIPPCPTPCTPPD